MNLGKLTKRLKKELAANPKQAVVLGIVSLVALWFYAPMLLKRFQAKPADSKPGFPLATASAGEGAPAAIADAPTPPSWLEVQAWRMADSLTRPVALSDDARDPFARPKLAEVAEQVEPSDQEQAKAGNVDPEKLTLVVESIVYGRTRRCAQINGQTVRENDPLVQDGNSLVVRHISPTREHGEVVGRVASITPTEVILELRGKEVRLTLAPKSLGRGEVIEVGSRK